jgi:uncharacterized protein (DUF934 family)
MQIIKNGQIVNDDIRHLADDEAPPEGRRYTVSLERWLAEKDRLAAAGLRLRGENAVADIAADLPRLAVIVLDFPALSDGRGFSQARLLRDRYAYAGEIRARGGFIRDQVYFLSRVGVDSFEPAEGTDLQSLLPALSEFSVNYQAAADHKEPVYHQRG